MKATVITVEDGTFEPIAKRSRQRDGGNRRSKKEPGLSRNTYLYPGKRYYLPTPPLGQDMTQGQFLSGV